MPERDAEGTVSIEVAAELAVSVWRLVKLHERWTMSGAPPQGGLIAQVRYLNDQMNRLLAEHEITLVDATGEEFVPNLPFSPSNIEECANGPGRLSIRQVLEPAVTCRGRVVRVGKVVLEVKEV
ncbi:MAG: hypothetical protein AMXMBFR36_15060 [Acidobacteriota bacterium]